MPGVIRSCGPYTPDPLSPGSREVWSDEEILMAFWEYDEQVNGVPNPMKQTPESIPELVPDIPGEGTT